MFALPVINNFNVLEVLLPDPRVFIFSLILLGFTHDTICSGFEARPQPMQTMGVAYADLPDTQSRRASG